ncbi:MAG: hypothetical protein WC464_08360 [Bdellovibrionales bacterium]
MATTAKLPQLPLFSTSYANYESPKALDDARRVKEQEYVKAAEKVLRNNSMLRDDEVISRIVEYSDPALKIFASSGGEEGVPEHIRSFYIVRASDVQAFYEDVMYEHAALSRMPRAAYDLTNELGRLLGSPKL